MWLEQFVYDVRYALRMWMGSPALAAVAILTIAIGIGASTAIAGQIKAVFWTTLAVSDPQALRQLTWSSPRFPYVMGGALNVLPGPSGSGSTFGSFSYTAYEALARDSAAGGESRVLGRLRRGAAGCPRLAWVRHRAVRLR